ncbi:MAG: hypothetical protein HWD61_01690 [Parachlamydiaceae bacterium]|nr:MAG: hypothetical protein HWD61_01690 [Parachlamydiaceae bacterium]
MSNKILPKFESYEQVKSFQRGEIGRADGRTYQIFYEKLTPGQSFY